MSATANATIRLNLQGFIPLNGASCLQPLGSVNQNLVVWFHSPKRGVMSATLFSNKQEKKHQFHSPKRGVMSATVCLVYTRYTKCFIPLNGASCLQLQVVVRGADEVVSFP